MLTRFRLPMLGRHYHYVYGYPWHWAILAEVAWRLEHSRLYPRLPALRWRKAFERRGDADGRAGGRP